MNTPLVVSVIVPVRHSGAHIQGLIDSLTQQDWPSYEVLLVTDENDDTQQFMPNLPKNFRWVYAEIPDDWEGRDTQWRRNAGAKAALGEYLFYTDGKIRHKTNWISQGMQLMREREVMAVAGVMESIPGYKENFAIRFTNKAFVRRNPKFGKGYRLTKANFGKSESLPITACFAMTRGAFEIMGSFPTKFVNSYEDYAAAWELVKDGGEVWCTSEWEVYHKHRDKLSQITREFTRSARGAADMFYYYPDCPFARRRVLQVLLVTGAVFVATLILIVGLTLGAFVALAVAFLLGISLYAIVGAGNVRLARHWQGFFFPALTGFYFIWFSYHFLRRTRELQSGTDQSGEFLQLSLALAWFMTYQKIMSMNGEIDE